MGTETFTYITFNATSEEVAEWGRTRPFGFMASLSRHRNGRVTLEATTKRPEPIWEFLDDINVEGRDPEGVHESECGFVHTWPPSPAT